MTPGSSRAAAPVGDPRTAAFEFVAALASEISGGRIELPSFPEVAIRVRKALADEKSTIEQIVRIVGAEPALAARLLRIANSAALNRSGRQVTELRTAIARLGHTMVRTVALAFAMAQIRAASRLKAIEQPLAELWRHSTTVAALCYVLARGHTRCNADEAFLAGLLHGVGRLYILARAERFPALFADAGTLEQVQRDWHASIARALLESWGMGETLVQAVAEQDEIEREHEGPPDLVDVLVCANMMSAHLEHPEHLELNMQGVAAFARLGLDAPACAALVRDCRSEIDALRHALGG